jgi:hypothetical protein
VKYKKVRFYCVFENEKYETPHKKGVFCISPKNARRKSYGYNAAKKWPLLKNKEDFQHENAFIGCQRT